MTISAQDFSASGYPVTPVIDGNLTIIDPTGTGKFGILTAQQIKTLSLSNLVGILSPSGDQTGLTDTAALTYMLATYSVVLLLPGIYYINQSIQIPSATALLGFNSAFGVPIGNYGLGSLPLQGSIITPVNAFEAPDSGNGVLFMESNETQQAGGQNLSGISLDCSQLPNGNNLHGIAVFNAIAAASIEYNTVYGGGSGQLGGDCFHAAASPNQPPDLLTITHNHFAGGNGWGAFINGVADSYVRDNECTGNELGGWSITNGNNSRYIGNKGEQSKAGPGWLWTFATGFTGIVHSLANTSQDNFQDGTRVTGPGTGTLEIADLGYDSDGQNGGAGGGGFAGLNITSFGGTVVLSNVASRLGTIPSPQYGIAIANSNQLIFDIGNVGGTTAGIHNAGGNTNVLIGANVVQYT
jgi:hypothetical protein